MSQLYPQGAAHILGKTTTANMAADTLVLIFYAGSFVSTHEFISDLTGGSIVARSSGLSSKTTTNGTLSSANPVVSSVSGSSFSSVVLAKSTGVDSTSPLIAYFTLSSPFVPTGRDVNVIVSPSGLFSIA